LEILKKSTKLDIYVEPKKSSECKNRLIGDEKNKHSTQVFDINSQCAKHGGKNAVFTYVSEITAVHTVSRHL
jgi:hypothetical protein